MDRFIQDVNHLIVAHPIECLTIVLVSLAIGFATGYVRAANRYTRGS